MEDPPEEVPVCMQDQQQQSMQQGGAVTEDPSANDGAVSGLPMSATADSADTAALSKLDFDSAEALTKGSSAQVRNFIHCALHFLPLYVNEQQLCQGRLPLPNLYCHWY